MKKRMMILAVAVLAAVGIYFIGSGFLKATSVYISDYSVSEDGTEMTVKLGVASSAGYIRKAAVHQQQGGRLYLDCYSAFGGFNGSIGAREEYTIPLAEETEVIAICSGGNGYQAVLEKDGDGNWQRVKGK